MPLTDLVRDLEDRVRALSAEVIAALEAKVQALEREVALLQEERSAETVPHEEDLKRRRRSRRTGPVTDLAQLPIVEADLLRRYRALTPERQAIVDELLQLLGTSPELPPNV